MNTYLRDGDANRILGTDKTVEQIGIYTSKISLLTAVPEQTRK